MDLLPKMLAKGSTRPPLPKKLRVYGQSYSPFVQRVETVLFAKGVDFEKVPVNVMDKPEWYTAEINPVGKIPAIELPGGNVLQESVVCCEYFDDAYPNPPLYPQDPYERNKQRLLIVRFDKVISLFYTVAFGRGNEQTVTDLKNNIGTYEKELSQRKTKFFGGAKPGMLDYMVYPILVERWILVRDHLDITVENFPKIHEWATAMRQDPAVKKAHIPEENHYRFIHEGVLPLMNKK